MTHWNLLNRLIINLQQNRQQYATEANRGSYRQINSTGNDYERDANPQDTEQRQTIKQVLDVAGLQKLGRT